MFLEIVNRQVRFVTLLEQIIRKIVHEHLEKKG